MTMEYVSLPGETAPPVPDGPKLCDGDDMRILHNAFLWAYEEAPGLARGEGSVREVLVPVERELRRALGYPVPSLAPVPAAAPEARP